MHEVVAVLEIDYLFLNSFICSSTQLISSHLNWQQIEEQFKTLIVLSHYLEVHFYLRPWHIFFIKQIIDQNFDSYSAADCQIPSVLG